VAAAALEAGLVEANVTRAIADLRPLHDHAVSAVDEELGDRARLLAVPGGGYYVSVHLDLAAGDDEAALRKRAAGLGLTLAAGSAFHPFAGDPPAGTVFVRIPFPAMAPAELRDGLRRLRRAAR
jgi:2-aminoadipate transaminase